MPPRIPLFQCLRAQYAAPAIPSRTFTSSASAQASTGPTKRKHRDPYAIAQAKARKAANLSRQEVLQKERATALGDPVKGVETPFLRSLDTGSEAEVSDTASSKQQHTQNTEHLRFFVNKQELEDSIDRSAYLSTPTPSTAERQTVSDLTSDSTPEQRAAIRREERDTAKEALRRISSLSLASNEDLKRVNTQRVIETFGRHNTDNHLPPRPAAETPNPGAQEKTPRVGPDTGSSEVQIALLTAKIRTLSQFLETRGTMDKVNKRNLRLLVHRRQKHMAYLRRKERGGPRWQNLVETLGLTEGMWRGQIVLDRNMKAITPGTLKHTMYKESRQ